jgi:predicted alpha/beta-hydrolase family hydrolase
MSPGRTHGSRDAFGTIEEMTAALRLIPARTQLLVIESARHELMSASNCDDLPETIVSAFTKYFE